MAKMKILFDGFEDLAADIDRCGGDVKEAVTEALQKTQDYVSERTSAAASPYASKGGGLRGYATGKMYNTIIKNHKVDWKGHIAEVSVGFKLRTRGGWHSIFVMYGTPRMSKDKKIYNAIKGTKTKKEIAKIQQEVMQEHLRLGGE